MRRVKFVSVFVLLALLLSAGIGAVVSQGSPPSQDDVPATATPQLQGEDLQPGVREFIADNYLSHAAEYPDPNETEEPLRLYLDGQEMLRAGKIDEAVALFKSAVADYPDSRHAHAGLGWALWQRHQGSQAEDDLRFAMKEFIRADEIGMRYGRVHYPYPIATGLGWLKDSTALDSYFEKALKDGNEPYLTRLDYARGLSLLGDPRAEAWYEEALAVQPEGVLDAVVYYAEWLLDHRREAEVVDLVSDDMRVEYVHFLKGVALERLGQPEEVRQEYDRYRRFNADFPAPARYRIAESQAQTGLIFEGDPQPLWNNSQAIEKLAWVISGEARSESLGGRRAVGWTVRTRVFRAYNVSPSCGGYPGGVWDAEPPGASLADKYVAICDASGQFAQYQPDTPIRSVASDVFYGTVPDPVSCNCIWGSIVGSCCTGTCTHWTEQGAFTHGPAWIWGTSSSCPLCHPYVSCSCLTSAGKTCGNGGSDNCFYKIQ